MHLGHCLHLVAEINLFGYGKYCLEMSLIAFQCCKGIHRMLKWSNGIRQWIFCSRVAMITLSRYDEFTSDFIMCYSNLLVQLSVKLRKLGSMNEYKY